ncbi:polysaccharide biosynthesis tyrosine autokinase [Arthrobacter sp. AB6]|uniref:polysaccharide biosynthesis tyrosine autokinase n=1 Tax=Arthrobacter sp. AB6 TaxID=2962570 RepID=UPI00288211A2|nr:polysaccharide biosynthesis tyrosine autokinase [Arthrobacter sp. AB6]MDT0193810.1 polysaccharide biosynthesis tyrosine autokinase [Arthrobacter sp. AB6]
MELKDYLRIIRRNWIVVVACALIGILGAGAVSLLMKPNYRSETKLFVALQNSGSVSELQQGNAFSQARVQSYVKTVTTPTVLQPVIDSLDLKVTPQALAKTIVATSDLNTVLISISVQNESPVRAAAIAQSVSRSLIAAVEELEKPSNGGTSPVKLSIVTPAVAPVSPHSPNVQMNLVLGLFAGLASGVGLAVLRAILDTRIRGEADLRRVTSSAVLGGISFDTDAIKKPLLTQAGQQSPRAESFRQLRTNLQFAHVSHESKTVLVTSSIPGEGKSTTATNLAIAMAESGQSVALVDADLRRPMVAEYLGLERNAGLTTALIGKADVNDVLQSWGDGELYVLTSGQIPPNPSELLGSEKMRQLITRLESVFDAVIIDAPPLLPVTDAAVLAQQVGGVVVVVGTQKVRTGDLEKSLASLQMVHADVLGIVLNRLPVKGPDAYAYGYGSYGYTSPSEPQVKSSINADHDDASNTDGVFAEEIFHGSTREATRFTGGRGQGA